MKGIDLLERLTWSVGFTAVGICTIAYVSSVTGAQRELDRFYALRAEATQPAPPEPVKTPDQRLWSLARLRAWQESLTQNSPPPLGVLRIRRVGLEVPLLEGTDDWTLNRAAGHIAGTAAPGADGNSGIAGHRDGFFRVLKDVVSGDALEVETTHGTVFYRIEEPWIVEPSDVSVLDATPVAAVTLVTCYPFYFAGSAPLRYIVRAVRASPTTTSQ